MSLAEYNKNYYKNQSIGKSISKPLMTPQFKHPHPASSTLQ